MEVISQKDLNKVIKAISDNNKEIVQIIESGAKAVNTIAASKNMKTGIKNVENVKKMLMRYGDVMSSIIEILTKDNKESKNVRSLHDRVKKAENNKKGLSKGNTTMDAFINLSKVMEGMTNLIDAINGKIPGPIKLILVKKKLEFFIAFTVKIIDVIDKQLGKKKLKQPKALLDLSKVVKSLKDIAKNMILAALMAIPAMIAMVVVTLFLFGLMLFIKAVNVVAKLCGHISKKTIRSIRRIDRMIVSIMITCGFLVLFALLAPIILKIIIKGIIPFLIIFGLSILVMAAIMWISSKLARFARKSTISLAKNLLLMFGALFVVAFGMVLMAWAGEQVMKSWKHLLGFLLIMLALVGVMMLIGAAMDYFAVYVAAILAGLQGLNQIMMTLLIAGGTLFALCLMAGYVFEHMGRLIAFLGLVIAFVAVLVALGAGLAAVSVYIAPVLAGLHSLNMIMLTLLIAGGTLFALCLMAGTVFDKMKMLISFIGLIIGFVAVVIGLGMALIPFIPMMAITMSGLTSMLIVIGVILVAGTTLYLLTVMAEKVFNNMGTLIAFVGTIIAFVGVLVGLGIGLTFLIPVIGISMAGLGAVAGLLGLMLICGLSLYALIKPAKEIRNNSKALIDSIGIAAAAILGIVAVGMAGIGAVLGLIFMPSNIALVGMFFPLFLMISKISECKLDRRQIYSNIDDTKATFKKIRNTFGKLEINWFDKTPYVLRRVDGLVFQIGLIIAKLNFIQTFKLDREGIMSSIQLVFDVIAEIEEFISKQDAPPQNASFGDLITYAKDQVRKKIQRVNALKSMLRSQFLLARVQAIAERVSAIQDIPLDKEACLSNLETIFTIIDDIEKRITKGEALPKDASISSIWSWAKKKVTDDANRVENFKKMNRSAYILMRMKSMAENISAINDLIIDKTTVIEKLGFMFDLVDDIDAWITNRTEVKDKDSIADMLKTVILGPLKAAQDKVLTDGANAKLSRVDMVLLTTKNMCDSLNAIQDIKLNKETIINNLNQIFGIVDEVSDFVLNKNMLDPKEADLIAKIAACEKDLRRKNEAFMAWGGRAGARDRLASAKDAYSSYMAEKQRIAETSAAYIERVNTVMSTVSTLSDALQKVEKFKVSSPQKVLDNVGELFGYADSIWNIVMDRTGEYNEKEFDKRINPVKKMLATINEITNNVATVDAKAVNEQKRQLDNYANFISHINTVDVAKLDSTTKMFKQMSAFSTSMKDDLTEVTKALVEKLLPALEDLREITTDMTEKLENGFKDAAASIHSVNKQNTIEDFQEQVKRETKTEQQPESILKEALRRFNDQSKTEANGVSAKLDELISLLRGYNGTAIVRVQ